MVYYDMISFVLDIATGLLGGACLLRCYMHWLNLPLTDPLGRFVLALTDWLVLPLRRLLPLTPRWDWAALAAALLLELVHYTLLGLLAGKALSLAWLPALALTGLVRLAISGLSCLILVHALLSWTQTVTPISALLRRLCEPLLSPVSRRLPLVGGVDLSPLVVLVVLQLLVMVVNQIQLRFVA